MKVIDETSIKFFDSLNPTVQDVVEQLKKVGACEAFDDMADTVYAPNGMTHAQWEKWLVEHKDHVLNRFVV